MRKVFYLGVALAGSAGFALAANGEAASLTKPRPSITALRVEQPPVINGVLDDNAWQKAPAAGDFMQYEPKEGVPMTERTEFRVLYDSRALYIGIWCYDSEPNKILARTMSRDDYPDEDDFVSFSIDPFLDRRNGYMFAINPNGTRFDAIINNNAYAGNSWDAIWSCRGNITDKGWFCEIAIPFDSIPFEPNNSIWGFNISRTIRRKNERGRWHSEGRHLSTSAMANAGEIRGLEGLGNITKWEVLPYGMGKYRHNNDTGEGNTLGDIGGDIAYRLAPNLRASLSVNTDFAETEVDYRQLNFTRFSLQYPEKRDFFLKDSGVFKFGPPSERRSRSQSSTPFFSRRIGLTDSGHQVPINLATKITGRVGKYNIGMIGAMIDEHDDIDRQSVYVTRISRDVLDQSSVGMINTIGDPNSDKNTYMIGTDFNYRTTKFLTDKTLRASLYTMANFDDDTDWSYAQGAGISYPNDLIDGGMSFYQVDEEFKPKLGYTRRTGIRRFGSSFSYRPRPENIEWLRKYHLSYRNSIYTTLDNDIESQQHRFYIPYLDFESGQDFYFLIEQEYDKPDRDFDVSGGGIVPAGEYWMTNYVLDFDLKDSGLITGGFGYELGDWYHGEKQTAYFRLGFDPAKWLNTSLSYSINQFELPDTEFDAQIASGNIRINFTPDMGWSHLIQYDNVSESIGYNTRFFWEFKPGKKFYVVIRQNYGDEDHLFSLRESEFAIKALTPFRF